MYEVIKVYDVKILDGHRNKDRQQRYYRAGKSKVEYPNGKHNVFPSDAIDVAPYPIDWFNLLRFYYLGGLIIATAKVKGYKFRWGGDWRRSGNFKAIKFKDLAHFERIT